MDRLDGYLPMLIKILADKLCLFLHFLDSTITSGL